MNMVNRPRYPKLIYRDDGGLPAGRSEPEAADELGG
jgi:hypothetical protein